MKSIIKSIIINILTLEARLALSMHKPLVIGVTGSVGKTSTKDAIATVVGSKFYTRKSLKSENSEIGVPLTILGLHNAWNSSLGWTTNLLVGFFTALFGLNFPKLLVLEIGADHPGDIQKISKWLKPDIAVFTRMSDIPVHVAYFKSPGEVFKEKSYLASALKSNGTLVLNSDDDQILSLKDSQKVKKIVTYGISSGADVRLTNDSFTYESILGKPHPTGFRYEIKTSSGNLSGQIKNALGKQHIYPILSAVAVGVGLNISIGDIENSLKNHETPVGRMRIVRGVNNSTIIDDTYNSSPVALNEALNTLGELDVQGKRIAVLGDMRELGSFSEKEHEKAGRKAAKSADFLIFVGENVLQFVKGALEAGINRNCIFTFDTSVEAGEKLKALLATGDVALVKGSQFVRMEKALVSVLANPDEDRRFLVRQEAEWQKR